MRRRAAKNADADEVEEMLRAAEDDLLLNLTRNTHATHKQPQQRQVSSSTSTSTSSVLDSDLACRFDALKSTTTAPTPPSSSSSDIGGEVAARFAALKVPTTTSAGSVSIGEDPIRRGEEEKPKDEVEEIVQWALDNARLGSTEKDGDETSEEEEESDGSDEDERKEEKSKGKSRGKGRKKWFF